MTMPTPYALAVTLGILGFALFGLVMLLAWAARPDDDYPHDDEDDDVYGDMPRVWPPEPQVEFSDARIVPRRNNDADDDGA